MATSNEIDGANRMRKQELIFALLKNRAKKGESIFGEGTLECCGRLRLPALARHFLPREHGRHLRQPLADPALQPAHRRFDRGRDPHAQRRRALLRSGQGRQGQRRRARGLQAQDPVRESHAAAPGQDPQARARHEGRGNITSRIIDIIAPIGKGQRGLIVSRQGRQDVLMQQLPMRSRRTTRTWC